LVLWTAKINFMVENGVLRATKNIVVLGFTYILAYSVEAQELRLVLWMQIVYGLDDGVKRATFNLATEGSITTEAAICLMVVLSVVVLSFIALSYIILTPKPNPLYC
jgi:hypothetical protein